MSKSQEVSADIRVCLVYWRCVISKHGLLIVKMFYQSALILGCLAPLSLRAQIVTDNSLGKGVQTLSGPAFAIPDSLGAIHGQNLFHSFQTFNLNQGQSATFTGPSSIANVFSRVTGGTASTIDGTLRCTIPSANFFPILRLNSPI